MWSNRSTSLISKIWGTSGSNVADTRLTDPQSSYARSAAEPVGRTAFTVLRRWKAHAYVAKMQLSTIHRVEEIHAAY